MRFILFALSFLTLGSLYSCDRAGERDLMDRDIQREEEYDVDDIREERVLPSGSKREVDREIFNDDEIELDD